MTQTEIFAAAREKMINCKACPECNGLACGNTMPGPGSKGPGLGAHDNWKAWQDYRLNVNTFAPDGYVDTSFELFGRSFSMPVMAGPIGALTQYSVKDVTVDYNDGIFTAAASENCIACFGDGLIPTTFSGGVASMEKTGAGVIPVMNPMPNAHIASKLEKLEESSALAVSVVVDSAGLNHWKKTAPGEGPGSKTVADLQYLRSLTKKPFVIKGIMTADGAKLAVDSGADAVIVSNHGGRVLPYAPATADVLPEIAAAVKGQTKIIVDGGLRSGADIVKAIALGADAVLICRPFPVYWFGGGVEGVRMYMQKLRNELNEAMYMTGARKLSDIGPDTIRFIKR